MKELLFFPTPIFVFTLTSTLGSKDYNFFEKNFPLGTVIAGADAINISGLLV